MSVAHIKKTKTAILVPNALVIATASDKVRRSDRREATAPETEMVKITRWKFLGGNFHRAVLLWLFLQYVFVSFLSRDNTYKVLMSICPHLEVGLTPSCSYKRALERMLTLLVV